MQQTDSKNFRFLVEREAGHTQIVTAYGATHAEAMLSVCNANPGRSVERYRASLAREKGATEHERTYPGTSYQHGSPADPATWDEGDIIEDKSGSRALVTAELNRATGGVCMVHLAPGERCDGDSFNLHVLALTNTYSYQRAGQVVPDALPESFERAAPSSMVEDTAAEKLALVQNA